MQDKSNTEKQTLSQTESNTTKTTSNKTGKFEEHSGDVVISTESIKSTLNINADNAKLESSLSSSKPSALDKEDQSMSSKAVISPEQLDEILNQTSKINQQLSKLHQYKMLKAYNSIPHLLWFNLLKGAAFGLGSVLGATVVLSVVVYLLSQIEFIPFIGEWVSAILEVVKAPAAD